MKRPLLPIAAAILLAACAKHEPPPQPNPEKPAAPVAEEPTPTPAAKKRTPIPAAKPAEPAAGAKTDDIEKDAVNLDNLSQPLVVKEKKPDAEKPQDSSK